MTNVRKNSAKLTREDLKIALNSDLNVNLFDERFIVFEIDKIKDDPVLFPIVVLIIMDVFLQDRKSTRLNSSHPK